MHPTHDLELGLGAQHVHKMVQFLLLSAIMERNMLISRQDVCSDSKGALSTPPPFVSTRDFPTCPGCDSMPCGKMEMTIYTAASTVIFGTFVVMWNFVDQVVATVYIGVVAVVLLVAFLVIGGKWYREIWRPGNAHRRWHVEKVVKEML